MNLSRPWSDISDIFPTAQSKVRILSIDGPALNRLYVASELKAGDGIVKQVSKDKPAPMLRADMSDTELVEFVVDSIAGFGYQRPEAVGMRPAAIGASTGVRFELATQTSEGLLVDGTSVIVRQGDLTYALIYLAPREHYYETNLKDVETIFASLAFGKKKPALSS